MTIVADPLEQFVVEAVLHRCERSASGAPPPAGSRRSTGTKQPPPSPASG